MAARYRWAGVMLVVSRPASTPLPCGRSGVRSPLRNGSITSPSAPGGVFRRCPSPKRVLKSKASATCSVTTVQFMVQISGSQPPVDEQNAAQAPSGSTTGVSE
ncbi:hypothetical protein D9M71_736980 [compost metagenome]